MMKLSDINKYCAERKAQPMPHNSDGDKVHKVMSEFKHGVLKSSSGKKVKSRKQAVAIGLSEARRYK